MLFFKGFFHHEFFQKKVILHTRDMFKRISFASSALVISHPEFKVVCEARLWKTFFIILMKLLTNMSVVCSCITQSSSINLNCLSI